MAIRMRKNKDKYCSCSTCGNRREDGHVIYDIGFELSNYTQVVALCDECMHELLTKLIKLGCDK